MIARNLLSDAFDRAGSFFAGLALAAAIFVLFCW
jgi:hypothetical protein